MRRGMVARLNIVASGLDYCMLVYTISRRHEECCTIILGLVTHCLAKYWHDFKILQGVASYYPTFY